MGKIIGEGITFDDVLLVPSYSEVIVDDGARDGDALLLAARERRDVGVLIAVEVDELQRVLDLVADVGG